MVHFQELILPPLSEDLLPSSAAVFVGSVMVWSAPAFATGAEFLAARAGFVRFAIGSSSQYDVSINTLSKIKTDLIVFIEFIWF